MTYNLSKTEELSGNDNKGLSRAGRIVPDQGLKAVLPAFGRSPAGFHRRESGPNPAEPGGEGLCRPTGTNDDRADLGRRLSPCPDRRERYLRLVARANPRARQKKARPGRGGGKPGP